MPTQAPNAPFHPRPRNSIWWTFHLCACAGCSPPSPSSIGVATVVLARLCRPSYRNWPARSSSPSTMRGAFWSVNGHPVELRGREHPFFAFLFDRWRQGTPPLRWHDRGLSSSARISGALERRASKLHFGARTTRTGSPVRGWIDNRPVLAALRVPPRRRWSGNAAKRLFPDHGPVGLPSRRKRTAPLRP